MAAPESSTESTDRLAEKVSYIEDSSFEQSEPDSLDPAIPQGGFECQFVEKPPENVQYECPVCQLVLREPYVVDCCGQNFCRACIKRIQADEKPCPTCKQAGFLAISDQKHQRSLYPLHVQCSHEKEGCQWTGQLGELDKHLNENPKPDEQLLGCEYAKICCVHCSELFLRPSIATHQNEECPQRPFSCIYCRSYKSSHEDIVNSHWHVCDCYPVSCLNQCGVEPERQNLEHHVSSECPLTVVNCDFRCAGCEVKLPRKDMPAHVTDNLVVHMSLLAMHSQKTVKENVELKEELVDIRKQLEVQSQKTVKEDVELKKELAGLRQQMKAHDKHRGRRVVGAGGLIGVAVIVLAIVLSLISQITDKQKHFEHKIEEFMKLNLSQRHGSGSKEEFKRDIEHEMEALKIKVDLSQQHGSGSKEETEQLKRDIEDEMEALKIKVDLSQRHGNKSKEEIQQFKRDIEHEMEALKIKVDLSQQHGSGSKEETEQLKRDIEDEMEALKIKVDLSQRHGSESKEEIQQFKRDIEHEMEALKIKVDLSQQHGSGSKEETEQLKRDLKTYIEQEMKSKVLSSEAKQSNNGEPSVITSQIVPVELIMTHFEKHKKGGDRWFSDPFYTTPAGYKMCLSVVANGVGSGKGTHVTVSVHLMRGEFDDDLKWPFRGDITIQLLNQLEDKEHHERTIQFTNNFPNQISGRITKGNRAKGRGFDEFILHHELSFNCTHHYQYLKYDSLQFRVSKVELMHDVVPFHAIMKKFDSTSDNWYSDPFFTHPQGYRICLSAAVNKDGLGGESLRKLVIIQVSIYILHGEYDDCLKWPFQGNITVQLLNQMDNKESFEQIVQFTDEAGSSGHFTTKERVEEIRGWKTSEFILTNKKLNHQLVDDGSLHFEVSKVEMLEKTQGRSFKCLYLFC